MMRAATLMGLMGLAAFTALGCGSGGVGSDADAKRAYLGLDGSIDKAITLGLQGYDAASSANIPAQTAKGTKSGTLTVTGHVDQGNSSNKSMHLSEALAGYSDDGAITYDTSATLPGLAMELKGIPNGTLSGTLAGTFTMTGQLPGELDVTVSFEGQLEPVGSDVTKVERKAGTTHVTGTASSGDFKYAIDLTR